MNPAAAASRNVEVATVTHEVRGRLQRVRASLIATPTRVARPDVRG